MSQISIPTFDRLMNPLIKALKELGGSGTIEEIDGKVAELAGLSDGQLEVLHNPDKGSQTEVEYRLAWTRTYLKKYGILENSSRGVHKRLGEREAEGAGFARQRSRGYATFAGTRERPGEHLRAGCLERREMRND